MGIIEEEVIFTRALISRLFPSMEEEPRVIEEEKSFIPMGGPLPVIPQDTVGFGGAAGMPHPATGYMVARALALAPELAAAMAECLSSSPAVRGGPMRRRMWEAVWPASRRVEREIHRLGMETMLRMDLEGTRSSFDAFFDLERHQWQGFLSSELTAGELVVMGLSLFGKGSWRCRADMAMKALEPVAMMARNLAVDAVGMVLDGGSGESEKKTKVVSAGERVVGSNASSLS